LDFAIDLVDDGSDCLDRLARGVFLVPIEIAPTGKHRDPLGKSQPTSSHHLKMLGEANLVRGDRRGTWVWYSLNRQRLTALRAAIDT
jgi:DNA-binding transcriptional ArsR family regulator